MGEYVPAFDGTLPVGYIGAMENVLITPWTEGLATLREVPFDGAVHEFPIALAKIESHNCCTFFPSIRRIPPWS